MDQGSSLVKCALGEK